MDFKRYLKDYPDQNGRFGEYGGQYIPETLMNAVQEVEKAYEFYKNDPQFVKELDDLYKVISIERCRPSQARQIPYE